jgi:hypothetical protein
LGSPSPLVGGAEVFSSFLVDPCLSSVR